MTDQHYDAYCCDLNVMTRCRFKLSGQQTSCRGYSMRSLGRRVGDNTCMWFSEIHGDTWLCTHPGANQDALRRFKENACMEKV
jgi:hypothetical protein